MIWLTIVGMSFITFANRYAFLATSVAYQPSTRVKQFVSYSSYAVLTAIWAPILFAYDPALGFSLAGWDYLIASLVAAIMTVLRLPSMAVVITSAGLFFFLRFVVLGV